MSGPEGDELPVEIDVETFRDLRRDAHPGVVDVREPWEVEICGFPEAVVIPLAQLPGRVDELPAGEPLVVICHSGRRSLLATQFLRQRGIARATNLIGGVEAWALTIDPTMPRY